MIHVHTEEQIMLDISLTGRPGINQFTAKRSRRPVFRRQREISVQLTTESRDWMWLQPQNWKTLAPWKKSYVKPRQCIKKQRHYPANKGLYTQSCGFSSSHVCMWEVDQKEGCVPKNWCFWIVVLEKTLVSPLDSKKIKPVNSKGNKCWIFIGRTGPEAEAPILWPPDVKSQLTGKDPDAGKDWRQEEKRVTEDEMAGWHHWLNGHEFEQTQGDNEGQGSLECCSSWGCKESDTTYRPNNNNHRSLSISIKNPTKNHLHDELKNFSFLNKKFF